MNVSGAPDQATVNILKAHFENYSENVIKQNIFFHDYVVQEVMPQQNLMDDLLSDYRFSRPP